MSRPWKSSRQDSFFKGEWFGLPAPARYMPFGKESRCRDEFGLTETQLSVLVAIVAAEFVGVAPVSARDIAGVIGSQPNSHLWTLEKLGWVEVEKKPGTSGKLYKPTAKAWRELGLQGWSLLKEVA